MISIYIIYITCMPFMLIMAMQWSWCEPTALRNQIFHPSASTEMRIFHVRLGKVQVGFVSVITGIIIKQLPWVCAHGRSPAPVRTM